MSFVPPQEQSIATAFRQAVADLLALRDEDDDALEAEDPWTSTYKLSDEIARLRIWAREHEAESGRLDYKLREASPLRDRVLNLLGNVSELATQHSIDSEGACEDPVQVPPTSLPDGDGIHVQALQSRDNGSDKSGSSSLDTNLTSPDSLLDTTLGRIHDVIGLLLDLGQSLKDPAPHNRFERDAYAEAAQQDINHVRAKFPNADLKLVERLGKANWERRLYLRKLRSAHDENPAGVQRLEPAEDVSDVASVSDESVRSVSDIDSASDGDHLDKGHTSAQDLRIRIAHSVNTDPSTVDESIFSTKGVLSTAATEVSESVEPAHQLTKSDVQRYRVPRPPEGLTGQPFLCPFCSHTLSGIESLSAWRKHVLEDLEPYMCTYTECRSAVKTYGRVRLWWEHETQRHRAQCSWVCNPCQRDQHQFEFKTEESFDQHFRTQHPLHFTEMQLQGLRRLCKRDDGAESPSTSCPLCLETITTNPNAMGKAIERSVRRHIADHLEQLAYFVAFSAGQMLQEEGDSEMQDDSDSEYGLQSEIRSIVSKDTHLSRKDVQITNVKEFIADQARASNDLAKIPLPGPSTSHEQSKGITRTKAEQGSQNSHGYSVAPQFPILLLMYPPNEHFYGRKNLLQAANNLLSSLGMICMFHGVGGVGKTLAAVEYIYTYRDYYDAVFWLQADTVPGLADSYSQMVMALGLVDNSEDHHRIIDQGRNWLQETDKRWLLVFDNALHWSELSRYLPNSLTHAHGSVLITSQHEDLLPPSGNVAKMRVEPLDRQAGSDMLLRYLGRDVRGDPEKHLAREISAFVGGLPVAIAQIAGYVRVSEITLDELIEIFRQWRRRTGVATDEADDLPPGFLEASFTYDGMLSMVTEVTLRELSEDARNVLNILAYLNCASVPISMLWGNMHEDPLLHFLDNREKIRMRNINSSLTKRRLVNLDPSGYFSMHRSLQKSVRHRLSLDKSKQQTVFDQAVALVREDFPRSNPLQQPSPEKWTTSQKLLPHLYALHEVYHKFRPHIQGSLDFAQLLLDAGMDQFEQSITHEGLLLLKTAEVVLDGFPPDQHQVMKADIHAMIAIMYDNTGIEDRQEALERREAALNIRRKIFEETTTPKRQDEMLLYNSWMEYAIAKLHYHRYTEAEPIIESCLKKFREWDSEKAIPFEYAKYYNKIALVRMYQGRFDEAIALAERGEQLMVQAGYNMFASRFKYDRGCIILQSGDYDEALRLHKEVHAQRVDSVGPTNELSLHSSYAIGAIYELKGEYEEAEYWLRKVLAQRSGLTSWPTEAYSRAQFHLAKVLEAIGRPEDVPMAESLRDKALKVLNRLYPLDVPPELHGVTDEAILFDHMLPISPGGPRFAGRGLLEYFMPNKKGE